MLDGDIQQELLRDTADTEKILSIAVNMEMGHQNQQRISYNNKIATQSMLYNNSIDFAARMLVQISRAEIHSVE